MKKRLLILLACLLLLLPLVLTSCGGNGDPGDPGDTTDGGVTVAKPVTLNFHIVTEDGTTDEARLAMQAAFNTIAKDKYKTQIEFIFCTAAEYKATVAAKLAALKASAGSGPSASTQYEEREIETELDEFDMPREVYPAPYENQLDILLITDKAMYDEFKREGYLADLTPSLNGEYAQIRDAINTNLMAGAEDIGRWYAIPNNVPIGSYKYLLVNRMLAETQTYKDSDFFLTKDENKNDVVNYENLLAFVNSLTNPQNRAEIEQNIGKSYYPLKAPFDFPTITLLPYEGTLLTENKPTNTVLGVVYNATTTYRNYIQLVNVYENPVYRSYAAFMAECKGKGYYPTTAVPDDTIYGIVATEGSYSDRARYEEEGYFVYVMDSPRLRDDEPFHAMFAVSSYSASVARSMEIIQDLLTEEELHNVLQYGAEGLHYTKTEAGDEVVSVTRISEEYRMNQNYTGNATLVWPCTNDKMPLDYNEHVKHQNDDAKRNPLYGMTAKILWTNTEAGMKNEELIRLIKEQLQPVLEAFNIKHAADTYSNGEPIPLPFMPDSKDADVYIELWKKLASDINPEKEIGPLEEEPVTDPAKDRVIDNTVTDLEKAATANVTTFLRTALTKSSEYATAFANVADAAAFNAKYNEIYAETNVVENAVGASAKYFVNNHSGTTWSSYQSDPFGLLAHEYRATYCSASAAGQLYYWWGIQAGNWS